jgi:hypothetical protein
LAGTLVFASAGALLSGSSLMVGANAGSLFAHGQGPVAAMGGGQSSEVGDQAPLASAAVVASPDVAASSAAIVVGAVGQVAKGPETRQIGNLPYVSRQVENLPASGQAGSLSYNG